MQNLICQSVTVTVQELSPTSLECLSFPPFSLVDSGTSKEPGVEGEHMLQFSIQIQEGKPSERVSWSFHNSFYMADQQTHPSLTVESAACLAPGNNTVSGMSGLVLMFWATGIPKHYREGALPWAAGKLCPRAGPPSAASLSCVSSSTAELGGGGSLEPLLQACATGWISLILLPAGSLPRKAHEELRGKVWMVPHSVCSSIKGSAPRQALIMPV